MTGRNLLRRQPTERIVELVDGRRTEDDLEALRELIKGDLLAKEGTAESSDRYRSVCIRNRLDRTLPEVGISDDRATHLTGPAGWGRVVTGGTRM